MSLYKGNNLISGVMPNSANQSLSNLNSAGQDIIDGKVSKTGDTMTGILTIDKSTWNFPIQLKSNDITYGVVPNEDKSCGISMIDSNDDLLGYFISDAMADGRRRVRINCRNLDGSDSTQITMGYTANGVAYCTFPHTDCVDGQWIYKNTSLGSSVTWNKSSHSNAKSYSLSSYLPNDGQNYEIMIRSSATTTSTSGKMIVVGVYSDIITTQTYICRCRTRSSSTVNCAGTVILPVGTGRKIYVAGAGSEASADGTYDIVCMGYRRIGTNS